MKRISSISIVFFSLVLFSCSIDDGDAMKYNALKITSATVPDTFELNKEYKISVKYYQPDDCTNFQGFDIVKKDTTLRQVVAVGSTFIEKECDTTKTSEIEKSFLFEVVYDKPYTFKFWQGLDSVGVSKYLEVKVPVKSN